MKIMHVALGGCLTAPPVPYGLTEDTGGHIGYVLGAAGAQAARGDVERVEIVTRAFRGPVAGVDCWTPERRLSPKLWLRRLVTRNETYLSKEALAAEIPALEAAFLRLLEDPARRPDVIHAHFADAARLAHAAAGRYGCKVVYTPHSLGLGKIEGMGGESHGMDARIAQESAALSRSDAVIVSTRDEAERQVAAYPCDVSGRVHRIAPGVPHVSTARPDEGAVVKRLLDGALADPTKPMILAVARPVHRKNLAGLLRAFAADRGLNDRANLVILAGQRGPGIEMEAECAEVVAELEEIARQPCLAGRVALPQRHGADEVAALYRAAAARRGVFVNVAFHEPFGLTLLEAAQAGLPVVATRHGGAADIIAATGHGRVVEPRDTAEVAAAIRSFITEAEEWDAASRAARDNARAFDWTHWAARAQRVYAGLYETARPLAARRILASDIDGTLTGCRHAARRFAEWAGTRDVAYVLATGRSITEARAVLAEWQLPEPDIFVSAVGTEIHRRDAEGRWTLCRDYAARLDREWDRARALDIIEEAGIPLQSEIEQRRWKLGCFGSDAVARRLRRRFAEAGLPARIVASHGTFIDILAPAGGKAAAVSFIARGLGCALADCISAGDSGNDQDMLEATGIGIVVGNALPELAQARLRRTPYRAKARHADGVLEGMARVGVPSAVAFLASRADAA